ncbi:nuclear transport factor 2 family protein [Luteipulveratus mongoliensis]|uniref:SnoaL-like domain-containing protein n=1 Tax=Luteipulveratus mongoliensis TaxID=571913 RepID=A0A0K1JHA4_9MICO|nr:nuclear transport factor 2 family protein [Luteipulveratus mongoliensis]AKU15968.1 hypothetical protein VV02_09070 [Luteipulveratus mongoliensis]
MSTSSSSALQSHIAAFNARDIEALMAGFAPDATWVTGADTIRASELREFFTNAFVHLTPRLDIVRIIDGGPVVVAQMRETWSHGGTRSASIAGIYDIANGLITSAKIYREGSADADQ